MSVQHNNYVRPAICECMTLLVCEKHFHDRIISLRGDFINKQLNILRYTTLFTIRDICVINGRGYVPLVLSVFILDILPDL